MKNEQADSPLDNLYIASPCSVPWDSMQGDDRTRLCGGCARNVYNISDMTKKEAEKFLGCTGTTHCMIFFRRQDGTILTDDCPVALRKIRDRCKMVARCAASIVAFFLALPSALAQAACDKDAKGTKVDTLSPAVKGNVYSARPIPAGGFSVIPPVNQQKPILQKPGEAYVPPEHTRGKPVMIPANTPTNPPAQVGGEPVYAGAPMITGTPTTQTTKPTDVSKPGNVKLHAEQNVFLHKAAHDFFKKGQDALAKSQMTLAEFYFDKALDSYDSQPIEGDAQFRKLIEQYLEKARAGKQTKPSINAAPTQ